MEYKIKLGAFFERANEWANYAIETNTYSPDNGLVYYPDSHSKCFIYDLGTAYFVAEEFNKEDLEFRTFFIQTFLEGYGKAEIGMKREIERRMISKTYTDKNLQTAVEEILKDVENVNKPFPARLNEQSIYNKGYYNGLLRLCKESSNNQFKKAKTKHNDYESISLESLFYNPKDFIDIMLLLENNGFIKTEKYKAIEWTPPHNGNATKEKFLTALFEVLLENNWLNKIKAPKTNKGKTSAVNELVENASFSMTAKTYGSNLNSSDFDEIKESYHFIPIRVK